MFKAYSKTKSRSLIYFFQLWEPLWFLCNPWMQVNMRVTGLTAEEDYWRPNTGYAGKWEALIPFNTITSTSPHCTFWDMLYRKPWHILGIYTVNLHVRHSNSLSLDAMNQANIALILFFSVSSCQGDVLQPSIFTPSFLPNSLVWP